jgi:DNA topoisomerase-3
MVVIGATQARVNKAKLLDAMGTFFARCLIGFISHSLLCMICYLELVLFFCRSNRPINETQNPVEVVRPCGACNGSEMVLKRRAVSCLLVTLFFFSRQTGITLYKFLNYSSFRSDW